MFAAATPAAALTHLAACRWGLSAPPQEALDFVVHALRWTGEHQPVLVLIEGKLVNGEHEASSINYSHCRIEVRPIVIAIPEVMPP